MIYDQMTRSLQRNMEEFAKLNNQLSSGKKIDKPSDDVFSEARAMEYRLSISGYEQYKRNITSAGNQLDFTDKVLASASDTLSELKHIVSVAATGSMTDDVRAIAASQTGQLKDQLLSLANSSFNNRFIFSGFKTDSMAFNSTTLAYQGDAGIINTMIDRNVVVPVNYTGSSVFSETLAAPEVIALSGGRFAHYTPGPGTTTNVEIRDTDDVTVIDTFSYSNFFEMAGSLENALQSSNTLRIEALRQPFISASEHILHLRSDVGLRMNRIDDQAKRIADYNLTLKNSLSNTEDADLTETITEIQKTDTALQALREASKRVFSQSLMDFLS
ncbi:MAG: flagellar hook-associated protein FlgL [Nitrospirae bacterium]|nr:flagellar hook-associated protein FlgL [Nitrospirota bacterium]